MAIELPHILRDLNAIVAGTGLLGRVVEVELPKITIKTEDYSAGGLDGTTDLDMGLEKMEMTLTLSEHNQAVLVELGKLTAEDTLLTLKGAIHQQGQEAKPLLIETRGRFREFDPGSWKRGDKHEVKVKATLNYYKLEVDGEGIYEIDVLGMKRIIDGEDYMESFRSAIED